MAVATKTISVSMKKTMQQKMVFKILVRASMVSHWKIIEFYLIFNNNLFTSAGAPVYISNPHFFESNTKFLDEVEGLQPNRELHESYFKIQPVSAL